MLASPRKPVSVMEVSNILCTKSKRYCLYTVAAVLAEAVYPG